MIVLVGDFIDSQSSVSLSTQDIQYLFDMFFSSIKDVQRLYENIQLILIPGPNDLGSDLLLPQFAMPDFIWEKHKNSGIKITLAQNPC